MMMTRFISFAFNCNWRHYGKAAIRDPDPVVFLENELLYGEAFPMSAESLSTDYVAPLGKALVMRPGADVTLVAFSKMVGFCQKAADELAKEGIEAEVINLRSLRPLDRDAIAASVRKTNRIVVVEEGWPQCGVGAEISAMVMEDCFDHLDAPVVAEVVAVVGRDAAQVRQRRRRRLHHGERGA